MAEVPPPLALPTNQNLNCPSSFNTAGEDARVSYQLPTVPLEMAGFLVDLTHPEWMLVASA